MSPTYPDSPAAASTMAHASALQLIERIEPPPGVWFFDVKEGIFDGAKFWTTRHSMISLGRSGKIRGSSGGGDFNGSIDKRISTKPRKPLAQLKQLLRDGKEIPVLD